VMVSLAEAGASGMHMEVGRANVRALGFYARLGFERLVETPDSVFVGRSFAPP
jgi:ribosomal protein S18 acetylase RimI-like enzyme